MFNSCEDSGGYRLSGASADGLDRFEQASHQFRCLISDPVSVIDCALAVAPAMAMAHVLRAWLYLLGTEPDGLAEAKSSLDLAAPLAGTDRERRHVAALAELLAGRWHHAARALEDLSIQYPRDALALQVGHQIDFFTGNARLLRDRIARALPAWDSARPGFHALLGMHAFGLEECGDYAAAEQAGRMAIDLEPRDSWAWHAVAHVHEMRNEVEAGMEWLAANEATWAPESFLAVHIHWHLALCLLELEEHDAVLQRYDRAIGGTGSSLVLDLVDASALLWRLHLRGIDVGERWQTLADRWAPMAEAGQYAFNDLHAMLAFVGAGRPALQERILATQRRVMAEKAFTVAMGCDADTVHVSGTRGAVGNGETGAVSARDCPGPVLRDNVAFTADVGAPAAQAVVAFAKGDCAGTVRLLRPLRPIAHRFGGSHAQRDLIDLTLIEAAVRLGDVPLVTALVNERLALRPRDWTAGRARARVSSA